MGVKENDEKANLVAAFFGPSGASKTVPKKPIQQEPASTRVPERVSYEPEGQDAFSEDDDDEIEKLIRAAEKEMKMKEAPPPPERSENSRALAMMKRLGNVTRIMQNGK